MHPQYTFTYNYIYILGSRRVGARRKRNARKGRVSSFVRVLYIHSMSEN